MSLNKKIFTTSIVSALCLGGARAAFSYDVSIDGEWHVADGAALDHDAVQRLYDYAFTRTGTDLEKKGVRTDGLVVVKGGEIVLERYDVAGGFTPDTPHLAWSVSKSAINALVGIDVLAGAINLDDPVSKFVPERLGADRDGGGGDGAPLLVRHVLDMSACLHWSETYEGSDFTASSVLAMLYGDAHRDMSGFVAGKSLECRPGSHWEYASGNTNLLARVLKAAHGAKYESLPWTALFDVIGVKSAVWERDAAGVFIGSSYLYATPRDYARFGYLFLKDGVWGGRRVLPKGWAAASGRPAPALRLPASRINLADGLGGAHWWSNEASPEKGLGSPWPSAPADMFAASGHWGQAIFVIPSLDMVIVRVGDDRDGTYDDDKLLALVFAAVKASAPKSAASPAAAPMKSTPDARHLHETPLLGIPGISAAFVAKELCSCLFVVHRSEEQCISFATQSPALATPSIDFEGKVVRAALRFASVGGHGLYSRTARFQGAKFGCTLD